MGPFNLAIVLALFLCVPLRAEKLPIVEFAELPLFEDLPADIPKSRKHLVALLQSNDLKNKKAIAALLAFPFPFGIVGLHRIYLGCSPHVPVVYIATVGGGFGLLPFIDFWTLLLTKDISQYVNNGQVFMWLK